MANSLINGTATGETPPPLPAPTVLPTWGYHADGSSKIFQLKPGEALPTGWADSPASVTAEKPKSRARKGQNGDGS